jgi:hypothetical protein
MGARQGCKLLSQIQPSQKTLDEEKKGKKEMETLESMKKNEKQKDEEENIRRDVERRQLPIKYKTHQLKVQNWRQHIKLNATCCILF